MGQSATITLSTTVVQYSLAVESAPAGITFQVDGVEQVTPWSGILEEGTHVVEMPSTVVIGEETYFFKQWEDGSTSSRRTIDLTGDMMVAATYTTEKVAANIVLLVLAGVLVGGAIYFMFRRG